MSKIAANLQRVRERVAAAASRAGRSPSDVSIVVVSKGVTIERVLEVVSSGATDLGENRVQEARDKWPGIEGRASLHLIGHLQTNKAAPAVEMFDLIHSVDSARVAQAIDRRAAERGKVQRILIEVNTSGEPSKHGIDAIGFEGLVDEVQGLPHLRLEGLMTMGPLGGGEAGARRSFVALRDLLRHAQASAPAARHLSMGMSGDFEIAVEEGATMVRVGTAVFER